MKNVARTLDKLPDLRRDLITCPRETGREIERESSWSRSLRGQAFERHFDPPVPARSESFRGEARDRHVGRYPRAIIGPPVGDEPLIGKPEPPPVWKTRP